MSNQGPEVTINGVAYKNLNEAVYALVHFTHRNKLEDGTFTDEVQAEIDKTDEALHAADADARNTPAPEGQEQKTYTQVEGYPDLYSVSHTYDSKGVKIQVGDLVTYKKGDTYHRITDIRWWMGRESISIQRKTNSKHGGVKHSFCGSPEIHAVVFDGRVAQG